MFHFYSNYLQDPLFDALTNCKQKAQCGVLLNWVFKDVTFSSILRQRFTVHIEFAFSSLDTRIHHASTFLVTDILPIFQTFELNVSCNNITYKNLFFQLTIIFA